MRDTDTEERRVIGRARGDRDMERGSRGTRGERGETGTGREARVGDGTAGQERGGQG